MAKNKVEIAIRETAKNTLSKKYNLIQYKEGGTKYEEKLKAITHKRVCEEIVAFADSHKNIPFYFILSVGVSKGAYKESEFNKGYKCFKADEVEMVAKMGEAYYAYNGQEKRKMSDVAIRLIMRYYEKVSNNFDTFIESLNKSQVLGKNLGSRDMKYSDLCKNLGIPFSDKETDNTTTLSEAA